MNGWTRIALTAVLSVAPVASALAAPSGWYGDKTFRYRRKVEVAPRQIREPEGAIASFLTHGQMDDQNDKVVVVAAGRLVPFRVVQRGPGDICKVIFQTVPNWRHYTIYYGAKTLPPKTKVPPWTARRGLLLEVHRWKNCNMGRFDSVKKATNSSPIVGAGYVPTVFMGGNPFGPEAGGSLIVFRGWLRVPKDGEYTFVTSSVDASFLTLDDKLVVQWAGGHWYTGESRIRGKVKLTTGVHKFEYYNAHRNGLRKTLCVAAWQPPGAKSPMPISPRYFGQHLEGKVHGPEKRGARGPAPDFRHEVARDALYQLGPATGREGTLGATFPYRPPEAVVRVKFHNLTPGASRQGTRVKWDFGDGQKGVGPSPEHVYLTTGPFKVTLTMASGQSTAHTIDVHANWPYAFSVEDAKRVDAGKPGQLETLMAGVEKNYDFKTLDGRSLVAALQVWRLISQQRNIAPLAETIMARTDLGDNALRKAAAIVTDVLCRQARQAKQAADLLDKAAEAATARGAKAELLLLAARVRLHYLDQPADARARLEEALKLATEANVRPTLRRIHTRLGDLHRRQAKPDRARQAYAKAEKIHVAQNAEDFVEQVIGPSVLNRYVQQNLKAKQVEQARLNLQRWEWLFPESKMEGFYSLAAARYYLQVNEPDLGIREISDLLQVSPDTPQAGQLIWQRSLCHARKKDAESVAADYEAMIRDYPGDPMVPKALWERAKRHRQRNNKAAAANDYQAIIRDYPSDPLVKDAKKALASLKN